MKKIILFLSVITAIISSCDKVDKPYLPVPEPVIPTSDTIRKILVEDYTGHRCPNCPRAAYILHNFQHKQYPKQIIGVAIHPTQGAFFTKPTPKHPNDYRTVLGDKYFNDFKLPIEFPMGTVNRKKTANGGYKIADTDWDNYVDTMVSRKPDALLKITNTYDASTGNLKSDIKCSFLSTQSGSYKIVVLLTQDSIVSGQDMGSDSNGPYYPTYTPVSGYVANYQHMHVLRDCIDGSGGNGIQVGPFVKGTSSTTSINYTLPANYLGVTVVPKHCHVVAFIYNISTMEVIQAEEAKF